jgi:hypothetical protein
MPRPRASHLPTWGRRLLMNFSDIFGERRSQDINKEQRKTSRIPWILRMPYGALTHNGDKRPNITSVF